MKTTIFSSLVLLSSIFPLNTYSQLKCTGNLVEYLTEVTIQVETSMELYYCACNKNEDFIRKYELTRTEYNKFLNSYITELLLMKSKVALDNFKSNNNSDFVNREFAIASTKLNEFLVIKTCEDKTLEFLPAAISVAEFTGIANSIIGLINEGKKRRDAQKAALIKVLEGFRIPSAQSYKCGKDK